MAKKRLVRILRTDNTIVVDAGDHAGPVYDLLTPKLSFTEKIFLRGHAARAARERRAPPFELVDWACFTLDHKNRIATSFGFLGRIQKTLLKSGYEYVVKDYSSPPPRPDAYTPYWERMKSKKFRPKQRRVLEIIVEKENARIDCPPGWGKSFLIACAAELLPHAKIAVVTRNVEVMQQRIYPELCGMLPDVGMVGGGKRRKGARVMCYTAGSVHHADGDEDYVFFDEGHQAASDDCANKMGKFDRARMFAFSASWDMRPDGKDMRCVAMFGPIRLRVSYSEAEEAGMVVPIVVQMSDVVMDVNPCAGISGPEKERRGIWANDFRNNLIAQDARIYDDDTQCLITVKTLEHALHLKKFLPEYEIVYNEESQKDTDWQWFRKEGLLGEDFKILSDEGRLRLRRRFERGKLKKVIATPVWNIGVDMRHLQVILRADAAGSPINSTQIPGRGSRIITFDGKVKQCAIVHDYMDQFDYGYGRKALGRIKTYELHEWEVRKPDRKKKSLLRQLMEWKDE